MSAELERFSNSDWAIIQEQAKVLASSFIVPKAYQGNPNAIIAAALYGREIGLGPVAALSYIHVIEGRPALSAEGMAALVRAQGHSIQGTGGPESAEVVGRRRDTGDEMKVTWTLEMARRAGLANKATWKSYPEAMLWARAVSQLCRMLFPDVLMGLSYTPEEVRDIVHTEEAPALPPCGVDAETGEIAQRVVHQVGPGHLTEEVEVPTPPAKSRDPLGEVMLSLTNLEQGDTRKLNAWRKWLNEQGLSQRAMEWSVLDVARVLEELQTRGWWINPAEPF